MLSLFSEYKLVIISGDPHRVDKGYLLDKNHLTAVPIVHHMVFFNEKDLFMPSILKEKINALYDELLNTEASYRQFVRAKSRNPLYDIYSCFNPFNEASKSFYPFINILKSKFKKGDVILDLWNRNGWSAALLAGLFPEQKIVTLWEGNKDVLGYKGFHHWFSDQHQIQVVFQDPGKPLPFADKSISLVYGADTLHRFDQTSLIKEVLRITKDDAAIIFPHVHLSNSKPQPFFERGCRQLHGLDYQSLFDAMETSGSIRKKGFVFSEPKLFWFNEKEDQTTMDLVSSPDMDDYNALVAMLPASWEKEQLVPFNYKNVADIEKAFVILNPLFSIDFSIQRAKLDYDHLSGEVGKLLARHPIYEKRVGIKEIQMSEKACQFLFLAGKILSVGEIKTKLNLDEEALLGILEELSGYDMIQVLPVRQQFARLQHFLANQEYVLPKKEQVLESLWQRAMTLFPSRTFLFTEEDESEFTYADADVLVKRTIAALQEQKIKKGDFVYLFGSLHLEQVVLFWACMHVGAVVTPLCPDMTLVTLEEILSNSAPALILVDGNKIKSLPQKYYQYCVFIDSEEEIPDGGKYFSDWLSENPAIALRENLLSEDRAVVLYTSGSTGHPKGVVLSHGHLVRSARLMTESFFWNEADRFYGLGDLDSMSGLRNSCIATVESGAGLIIPARESKFNARTIAESIGTTSASIIAVSPSLLNGFLQNKEMAKRFISSLRLVLSTGSQLSMALKSSFYEAFQLPIYNYYGLTETTGLCITESPSKVAGDENAIGWPIGSIAQITDERGNAVDSEEPGVLRIFGENIMEGYLNNPELSQQAIRKGWFYTGDIACRRKDGSMQLLGRKEDFVKTANSEMIFISEIENCIRELDGIREIAACKFFADDTEKVAVFAIPGNHEETVHDFVEKIKEHIAGRLGIRKIPSIVKIVEALPYGNNHKILKNKLLELI